jgi:hypothetical protein
MSLTTSNEIILNLLSFKPFVQEAVVSYKLQFRFFTNFRNGEKQTFARPYFVPPKGKGNITQKSYETETFLQNHDFENCCQSMCVFRLEINNSISIKTEIAMEVSLLVYGLKGDAEKEFGKDLNGFSKIDCKTIFIEFKEPVLEFADVFFTESMLPCMFSLVLSLQTNAFEKERKPDFSLMAPCSIQKNSESIREIKLIQIGDFESKLNSLLDSTEDSIDDFTDKILYKLRKSLACMYCFLTDAIEIEIESKVADKYLFFTKFRKQLNDIESKMNQDCLFYLIKSISQNTFKYQSKVEKNEQTSSQRSSQSQKDIQNDDWNDSSNIITKIENYKFSKTTPKLVENVDRKTEFLKQLRGRITFIEKVVFQLHTLLISLLSNCSFLFIPIARFEFLARESVLNELLFIHNKFEWNISSNSKKTTWKLFREQFQFLSSHVSKIIPEEFRGRYACAPVFIELTQREQIHQSFATRNQLTLKNFSPFMRFNKHSKNCNFEKIERNFNPKKVPKNTHLVVLVHGLKGSDFDLQIYKMFLTVMFPNVTCLDSSVNVGVDNESIAILGFNLANEVKDFVFSQGFIGLKKVSFIGHSLGGLIVRAALPYLDQLSPKMDSFISLGSPHLGIANNDSLLIKTGLAMIQKFTPNQLLKQLDFSDEKSIEDTQLFKLSQLPGLEMFKTIVLVSSTDDCYCNHFSSLIFLSEECTKTFRVGPYLNQMAENINRRIKNASVMKINIEMTFDQKNFDWLIGRSAHVMLIDSPEVVKRLLVRLNHLFEENKDHFF